MHISIAKLACLACLIPTLVTLPSECVSLSLPVSREIFILVVVVVAVEMW